MRKIILASQSPRRKLLLQWAEVPFEVLVIPTDEDFPVELSFENAAIYIARNKALAVGHLNKEKVPVLAADTIVVCNNKIFGKPADREDAVNILSILSGNTHEVISGVVILHNEKEISFTETTTVCFHSISQEQINFYVDKYKPYDKAGAYAIQEWIGVVGIKAITGDFYNVMGLPISRVVQELQGL
ncbi:MAG: Maf family nucleotide pyrophosphatase [Ferruginibacter sp.]